jgi:hypothetical protein
MGKLFVEDGRIQEMKCGQGLANTRHLKSPTLSRSKKLVPGTTPHARNSKPFHAFFCSAINENLLMKCGSIASSNEM